MSASTIGRYKRDTMKVSEFAHEFDRYNANNIGPGPAGF